MSLKNGEIVKPTREQVEWADCEVGVIIHYDIQVFQPDYEFRRHRGRQPKASIFNPSALDTDQWIKTAKAAGAKYAVLVAKHCSGFSLWPTEAHEYSIKNSTWKEGKGDIVGDFIKSCKKYGIRPGLYYSCSCNAYFDVDNPGKVLSGDEKEQERYNQVILQQLNELWGNYGKLFEIWFDGGILPPEMGGPDILPLMEKLQPTANVLQGRMGTRSLLRWVGNEDGRAPYPCWSTTFLGKNDYDGTVDCTEAGIGDPYAPIWAPAESDTPNRNRTFGFQNGWFWREGEDGLVYSAGQLAEKYLETVGNNTNLLLGMVIDNRGLVPDMDVQQFTWFGELIGKLFAEGNLLGENSGSGYELTVDLRSGESISYIVLMEDIEEGERVLEYKITGWDGTAWSDICGGVSIGHKKIHCLKYPNPENLSAVRFTCTEAKAEPIIRRMAVYKGME